MHWGECSSGITTRAAEFGRGLGPPAVSTPTQQYRRRTSSFSDIIQSPRFGNGAGLLRQGNDRDSPAVHVAVQFGVNVLVKRPLPP